MKTLFTRSATTAHYHQSVGVVVMYDITKVRTFQNAEKWINHLRETLADNCPVIMLVGNKLDIRHNRSVTASDGLKLAKKLDVLFDEVSAYDGTNVHKIFLRLIDHVTNKMIQADFGMNLPFNSPKKMKGVILPGSSEKAKPSSFTNEKDNKLNVIFTQPGKLTLSKGGKAQHFIKTKLESNIQFSCCFS